MKMLRRLYLGEFFRLFLLIVLGLSGIFSLVDLMGKIQSFLPEKSTATSLLLYCLYNVPKYLVYLLPMSLLISGMFTFSQAGRRKEITAIKAAGGRLRSLFYPFIWAGVLMGLFAFGVGEIIAPEASKRAVDLKNDLASNTRKTTFDGGMLWLRGIDGSPVRIDIYIAEKKMAGGVSIFVLGKDFLKERITAGRAFWDGSAWLLEDVTRYNAESGEISRLKQMRYDNLESPELFAREIKTTDEMDISELYHYMQRLKNAGFRNIKLAVDINSKISFPLINIFMMMLGISLPLRIGTGGGMLSAGLGLIISLIYGFGYTFFLSLGYAGIFHPLFAAWLMPVIFSVISVYLFMKIPE
ncbi:MAG: LptF/LptG family permease [Nitrospirae bacterium]|nr:LptF/LptG family permease [Nitrospirota bacterium]